MELGEPIRAGGDLEPWHFDATLTIEAGEASVTMWEYGPGPAPFFRSLSQDWRGWDGDRTWSSLEDHLIITARHDGLGLILCEVTIGNPTEPEWSLTATMTLGAGAHMEEVAASVARALA